LLLSKIWDTHTGETLQTLQHNHIVHCVAFAPNPTNVATGGPEKKLRIFDLNRPDAPATEIGTQQHAGTIKCVAWSEPNILVSAAEDKVIRWWDLRSREVVDKFAVDDLIGSCEYSCDGNLLNVAAGKSVYFFDGMSRRLLKSIRTDYNCSSVALHAPSRRFVAGGDSDTWARIFDYDTERELGLCHT